MGKGSENKTIFDLTHLSCQIEDPFEDL